MAILGNMPPYGDWPSRYIDESGKRLTVREALGDLIKSDFPDATPKEWLSTTDPTDEKK